MRINLKREKGITLVALIITIVILIILAAVTISSVMHEGFINVAINGTQNYAKEQYREIDEINRLADKLNDAVDKINNGGGSSLKEVELPAGWDSEKVKAYESEDKVTVPVPIGFTPSNVDGEKKVEEGFVIKQDGTANEFVWVPVPNPSEMFMTDIEGNAVGQLYDFGYGYTYDGTNWTDLGSTAKNPPVQIEYTYDVREPDILPDPVKGDANGDEGGGIDQLRNVVGIEGTESIDVLTNWENQLKSEIGDMKTSVETYKGFYIGRYETGNLSTSKAVVAKNNTDIDNVNWYVMYQRSKTIAEGTKATSSMIWGSQWDATLRWFLRQGGEKVSFVYDSTDKGNYVGEDATEEDIIPTGSEPRYSVNNIYDMAGNEFEWTLEVVQDVEDYGTNYRAVRRRQCFLFRFLGSSFLSRWT